MSHLRIAAVAAAGVIVGMGAMHGMKAEEGPEKALGHTVFFTLKERSKENIDKTIAACKKYLGKHEGTIAFGVGVRAEEFSREVNDKEFDVALHLVFKNKAAHDKYQDHPEHKKFIEENHDLWEKVRVFDDYIAVAELHKDRS